MSNCPKCSSPHKAKDRHPLGADTGDWVCLDCGYSWSRSTPTKYENALVKEQKKEDK